MAHKLPAHVKKYGESPVFTDQTVPKKLTSLHDTKAGVWGRICVLEGQINYSIPGLPNALQVIAAGAFGIIKPEELHHVEMTGPAKFQIEFYR